MLALRLPIPRLVTAGDLFVEKGSLGVLRALGASRMAVVVSSSLVKNPEASLLIKKALGATDHLLLEKSRGEPDLENIQDPLRLVADFRPDWVVAIGGGSVLDFAKLLWIFYEHPDLDIERALRPGGLPSLRGKAKFAAVPTTAGTGSEVSSSAVFFDPKMQTKKYFVSHDLIPDVAILDPQLSLFTPSRIMAISGMDALSHAVEGYVSRIQNPFLDAQSEQAVKMVFESLDVSMGRDETASKARTQMMIASTLAGWVQNLKLPGVGHALAHQVAQFGIPHGLACGIMLGNSVRLNSQEVAAKQKYERLAFILGEKGAEKLADRCDKLLRDLGLEDKLRKIPGVTSEDVWSKRALVAEGALADVCAKANPRLLNEDLIVTSLQIVL